MRHHRPTLRSDTHGFTIVEVITALALLVGVAMSATTLMSTASKRNAQSSWKNKMSAASQTMLSRAKANTTWASGVSPWNVPGKNCKTTHTFAESDPASGWCNISSIIPTTDPIFWNMDGETADQELIFDSTNFMYARGVDSSDDGTLSSDADGVVPDYYTVKVSVKLLPGTEFAKSVGTLTPVTATSVVRPLEGGTGSVDIQICTVTNQQDARMTLPSCNAPTQPRMIPPIRWNFPYFNDSPEGQAYACAHPDYVGDLTYYSGSSGEPKGMWDQYFHVTRCHTASPPYVDTANGPGYEQPYFNDLDWSYPHRPHYKSSPSKVLPAGDSYRYVESHISPVSGSTVRLTGIEPASISTFSADLVTSADGTVKFTGLKQGRYQISIVANGPSSATHELWKSKSFPGKYVTVEEGIEKSSVQVYRPKSLHSFSASIRNVRLNWPWDCNSDSGTLDLRRGIGMWTNDPSDPTNAKDWNGAFSLRPLTGGANPQGCKAPPAGYANEMYHSLQSELGICVILHAVPSGRVENGSKRKCLHEYPIPPTCPSTGCADTTYYNDGIDNPTRMTWTGLAPGLYALQYDDWANFLYRSDNSPGFIWIDENGTTFPEGRSSDTYYLQRIIMTWEYCGDTSAARWTYPAEGIKEPVADCSVVLPDLDKGTGGGGSS